MKMNIVVTLKVSVRIVLCALVLIVKWWIVLKISKWLVHSCIFYSCRIWKWIIYKKYSQDIDSFVREQKKVSHKTAQRRKQSRKGLIWHTLWILDTSSKIWSLTLKKLQSITRNIGNMACNISIILLLSGIVKSSLHEGYLFKTQYIFHLK